MNLVNFSNKKYTILKYMINNEVNDKGQIYTKTSQDEIANLLHIGKHNVNSIINTIKKKKCIERYNERGKYKITDLGRRVISAIEQEV